MKVSLLNATPVHVAKEAANCSTGKILCPSPTSLPNAVDSGHLSVLEHIYFTFLIEGISRACSHQLVRHRLASYTQESQRYCTMNMDNAFCVVPPSILKNDVAMTIYNETLATIAENYNKLINGGIPKEDARFLLPNACKTTIVMSMNARAFIEQCQKRLCNKAQWEIQQLYLEMCHKLGNASENYQLILNLCAAPCLVRGKCPETKPCNKQPREK